MGCIPAQRAWSAFSANAWRLWWMSCFSHEDTSAAVQLGNNHQLFCWHPCRIDLEFCTQLGALFRASLLACLGNICKCVIVNNAMKICTSGR